MPRKQKNSGFSEGQELLLKGATDLGLGLSHQQVTAFSSYLSLLFSWNSRFNLTSIKAPALITRLHFIDSIAIAPFILPSGRIMDVGSGAGFPGIPLKIVFPAKEVFLVESQRKKANFLRAVVRSLGLEGVHVIEARAEKLSTQEVGLFSEVVTRAFGSLERFLKISAYFLCPEGRSMVMHGPTGNQLFRDMGNRCKELGFRESRLENYPLPIGNEKRTLLIYVKK